MSRICRVPPSIGRNSLHFQLLTCVSFAWRNVSVFQGGMTRIVAHPQKTAQICQIKLDEKRDSRQKALGLFCVLEGLCEENSGAEIEGNRLNWLMCQENIGG